MVNDNENILLALTRGMDVLGVFDTIGAAIDAGEKILKGDRVAVDRLTITTEPGTSVLVIINARVNLEVRAIELNECHSIDGLVFLEGR